MNALADPPDPAVEGGAQPNAGEIMVQWIQRRIKTSGFHPSMWKSEHASIAAEFLLDPSKTVLFIAADTEMEELVVRHTSPPPPSPGLNDVAFFVRQKGQVISADNISEVIQFGTFDIRQDAASVLRIMEQIIYPQIFQSMEWSQPTKRELMALYHRSMAALRESANEDSGRTHFYIPLRKGEDGTDLDDAREAAKDRDQVQQFESVVIHWTRQIKSVLNSCKSSVGLDIDGGPMDEIALWNARAVDLSGIADQLQGDDIRYIVSVLEHSKSNYLAPLSVLSEEVHRASEEAASNIKFLDILSEPCQSLAEARLEDVPALFPSLVGCVRAICKLSPHYNTTEHAAGLLRKLSNEVARKCREQISLQGVFEGDESAATESLRESVGCCLKWKRVLRKTAHTVNKNVALLEADASGKELVAWDFGDDQFAQIDAFVQRCRDLIEICEGRMQFMVELDALEFGGTNGEEIKRSLKAVSESFHLQVKRIQQLQYDILDVRHSNWHEDYNNFKLAAKDLDIMYTNVIDKAFAPIQQLDTAVSLLDKFWNLAKREAIRRCVEKRAADIRLLFLRGCQVIRQDFDDNRREPPLRMNEPQFAGSALWARSLMDRIQQMWSRVIKASCPIVQSGDEADRAVESLLSALHAYQTNKYNDWMESLSSIESDDLKSRLEQPLLRRMPITSDAQLHRPLAVNFDNYLLALSSEVVCWERLHAEEFEIPSSVLSICHQREVHRIAREHVTAMVRSFNELLGDLTENESSLLFADHVRRLEKKIMPGLTKLTWTSRVVERFVQACSNEINAVHTLAKRFHSGMDVVRLQCRKVSSLRLISILSNNRYKEVSFESQQEDHRKQCIQELANAHNIMSTQLTDLYSIFQDCTEEVKTRWITQCVSKIDCLLLDALSTAVRKSLTLLCTSINGDESNGETQQTLFYLSVVLRDNRVETKPSLIDLTHTVNSVAKEIIGVVQTVSRLEKHFPHGLSTGEKDVEKSDFYSIISSNEAILNLVVKVMEGIAGTTSDIGQWLLTWNRYKSIWERDVDSFLRRIKSQPAATLDRHINTHKHQQVQIESENSSHAVKFMKLETQSLRAALVRHSVEWQEKLLGLFQRNAEASLDELDKVLSSKLTNLLRTPKDISQLKAAIDLTSSLKGDMSGYEDKIDTMEATFRTLSKYEAAISESSKDKLEGLRPSLEVLKEELASSAEGKLKECKALFGHQLRSSLTEFMKEVRVLRDNIQEQIEAIPSDEHDNTEVATTLRSLTETKRKTEANFAPGLEIFGIEPPDDKALRDCEAKVRSLQVLIELEKTWAEHWNEWSKQPINQLCSSDMEEMANSTLKSVYKLKRDASTWPIYQRLQGDLEQAKNVLIPVVAAMNEGAMQPRHWELSKKEFGRSYDLMHPLSDALEILQEHSSHIIQIARAASEESRIESCIQTMRTQWEEASVPIVSSAAGNQISSVQDILVALEEDGAKLTALMQSEYCAPFQDEARQLEQNVIDMKNILESMMSVQGKCLHLSEHTSDEFSNIKDNFMAFLGSDDTVKLQSLCEKGTLTRLLDMASKLETIQSSL